MEAISNTSSHILMDATMKADVAKQSSATTTSHAAIQQTKPTQTVEQSTANQSTKHEDAARVVISDEAKQSGVDSRASATTVIQQSHNSSNDDDPAALSDEERKEVERLKARDREVRTHEQAHLSALGAHKTGGASFTYETGPDGNRYAVAGEVPVDTSEAETPEKTIQKAQTIRRAALAPAEPSGADRAVAAQASQMESRARAELAEERSERLSEGESANKPQPLDEKSGTTIETQEQTAAQEVANAQRKELEPEVKDATAMLVEKFQTPKTCPVCGADDDGHSHYEAVS